MNVSKIWLMAILISTALLGIILVQAYWIQNAISLRKTLFDQQVNEAMHIVVKKMEEYQAARLMEEQLRLLGLEDPGLISLDSLPTSHPMADSVMVEVLRTHSATGRSGSALDLVEEGKLGSVALNNSMSMNPFGIGNIVQDSLEDDAEMLSNLLLNVEQQIIENIQRFNTVMDKVLLEMIRGMYGPTRSIDPQMLDSLLNMELAEKGIHTPYQYGVLIGQDKLLTTAGNEKEKEVLLSSLHRVSLSPSSLFTRPDELYLSFPAEKNYLLRSMWTLLSGSALFTLVIIFGFSYTINALFRQKKLSDIKTDFINNMTHEFKTPIATISLAVDSIVNPRIISDQQRIAHYSGIIRDENRRMNAQVEKVLQMALLDRNEIRLNREQLDIHHIIQTAVDAISIQVENKGGQIITELNATQTQILGDEVHLVNVMQNLLDNANKYSLGEPHIRVESWNDKRGIFVAVEDKGIGMDRETQQRIFEKFYRLPKGNVHDVKGFGLGLTYVKALLDAHGASITVKSQVQQGSRFILYLPQSTGTRIQGLKK